MRRCRFMGALELWDFRILVRKRGLKLAEGFLFVFASCASPSSFMESWWLDIGIIMSRQSHIDCKEPYVLFLFGRQRAPPHIFGGVSVIDVAEVLGLRGQGWSRRSYCLKRFLDMIMGEAEARPRWRGAL